MSIKEAQTLIELDEAVKTNKTRQFLKTQEIAVLKFYCGHYQHSKEPKHQQIVKKCERLLKSHRAKAPSSLCISLVFLSGALSIQLLTNSLSIGSVSLSLCLSVVFYKSWECLYPFS